MFVFGKSNLSLYNKMNVQFQPLTALVEPMGVLKINGYVKEILIIHKKSSFMAFVETELFR